MLLRSERDGSGDGRVYHVAFRAEDPAGGFCTGEVEVCVRHDNGHGVSCGDQGPLFDSTPAVCIPADGPCELDDCVPPPPLVIDGCDDTSMPPVIERRLNRMRRLLERAAVAGPGRQRRLTRIARIRLARLDNLVARRLGGDCELEMHDLVEHASRCAFCRPDDDRSDDRDDDDRGRGERRSGGRRQARRRRLMPALASRPSAQRTTPGVSVATS